MILTAHPSKGQQNLLIETLPPEWQNDELFTATMPTDDFWWKKFDDALLDSLITIATERNLPLIGKKLRVLCDGVSKNNPALYSGRTEGNKIAFFEGEPCDTGRYVAFVADRADAFALYGKKVAP